MPASYSHTTRASGTVLTSTIYNGDHQNHIDNGVPAVLDDYSISIAQMQSTVDPGESGTESLATSLAGELERLRFAIKELKGKLTGIAVAQWYSSPTLGSGGDNVFALGSIGLLRIGDSAPSGNVAIELGQTNGVASTPFIDFHSSAVAGDFNVRLIASGGTGSPASGTLQVEAAAINLNGTTTVNGSLAVTTTLSVTGATSLSSATMSTPLGVASGGTGLASLTANNVILGNAAGTPLFVAPGPAANLLTSNGTTWTSAAPAPQNSLRRTTVFTSSGTWTKNADTSSVVVVAVGGGGGSGGANSSSGFNSSGGGGGGGTVTRRIAAASLGATETVTVGAGGAAGAGTPTAGGAGGTSSFGAHASATGGGGSLGNGTNNTSSAGAAGGIGSGGDLNFSGDDGGTGDDAGTSSGTGGGSHLGGMAGPVRANNSGVAGKTYGSGASGSAANLAAIAGAAGAAGVVIVYEYS